MSISSLAVQGMNAASISQSVTANNIANMNTDGFKSSRADFETGPQGQGVNVSAIRENSTSGPLIPRSSGYVEGSNTDLTTEAVNMIKNQTSYSAGAALIRTNDEMTGTLLDVIA